MDLDQQSGTISTWDKVVNVLIYIKTLLGGDRFEWNIDLHRARRPVLLIHGFAMPRHCMAILENRLTADGFDVFGFILGPANFLGVEKAARIIGIKLRHLAREHGLGRIAIVGHSLGGIIGRAFISLRRGDRLCHTLITLGSPHQGHPAWRWSRFTPVRLFTRVPRDLAPDSEVMHKLKANALPESVYAASVYSETDRICPAPLCPLDIPQGTSNLDNIQIEGINHLDLMVDPRVYDVVREHLERGFERAAELPEDPDETLPTY
jgi:hypothetical protein